MITMMVTPCLFPQAGVQREGIQREGVQREGVQREGVQREGIQKEGVVEVTSEWLLCWNQSS